MCSEWVRSAEERSKERHESKTNQETQPRLQPHNRTKLISTMMSLTGILSLFSALIATSDALSCTQCYSSYSWTCSGPSSVCPSGYECGSSYTGKTTGIITGEMSRELIRGCLPSSHCNIQGSIRIHIGYIQKVTSCCTTDDCVPEAPSFPTISTKPNGLVCQSCTAANSTWCSTSDTALCTGDESLCVLETLKRTDSGQVTASMIIRGCATKSICHLGSHSSAIFEHISLEDKFTCTSGGINFQGVILTPAISCLLLMKLFF
ncbi:phospholipase A2 inhibitor and Ly6/PLAUR domain-containing protein-like [Dendropsophus ebraccatus]|uniref:phospholipase A2 inhibitor and Ly6/PLAUR domain-containing protein-like n=1 Tax=Dendropsophus ebraccatus TaxID=150705 RepID=UPI00383152BE